MERCLGQKSIRLKVVTLERFKQKSIHHNVAKKFKFCAWIFNWKFNILSSFIQSFYDYILHNFLRRRLALNKLNSNLNTAPSDKILVKGLWMNLEENVKTNWINASTAVHVSSVFLTVVHVFHNETVFDSAHFWIKLANKWGISSCIRALKSWLKSLLHVRHFCAWYRQ